MKKVWGNPEIKNLAVEATAASWVYAYIKETEFWGMKGITCAKCGKFGYDSTVESDKVAKWEKHLADAHCIFPPVAPES